MIRLPLACVRKSEFRRCVCFSTTMRDGTKLGAGRIRLSAHRKCIHWTDACRMQGSRLIPCIRLDIWGGMRHLGWRCLVSHTVQNSSTYLQSTLLTIVHHWVLIGPAEWPADKAVSQVPLNSFRNKILAIL